MSAQHRVPVLLTRAQTQAARFAAQLPDSAEPVFSPLLDIVFLYPKALPTSDETLLFTSENGVAALIAANGGQAGQHALCVGDRTTEAASLAGFEARSAGGTVEDLLRLARAGRGPFAHIRGAHTRGDLCARLRSAGSPCRDVLAYDQRALPLSHAAQQVLEGGDLCLVPLFSPRTARLFFEGCPEAPEARLICLSAAVAQETARGRYKSCSISERPDAAAMLSALSCHL